jgi:hypothetical protein
MPPGNQGKVSSGFRRDLKCRKLICQDIDDCPFSSLTMNEAIRSYSLFAVVAVSAGLALGAWVRSRRKTPDQLEQERRLRISEIGRITDGTVIDVNELTSAPGSPEMQLLVYQYDVAGVSYEASQDVTSLRHRVDLHSCRAGLMTSIKYDPANPGNSIVIAENWNGLRQ